MFALRTVGLLVELLAGLQHRVVRVDGVLLAGLGKLLILRVLLAMRHGLLDGLCQRKLRRRRLCRQLGHTLLLKRRSPGRRSELAKEETHDSRDICSRERNGDRHRKAERRHTHEA